MNGGDGGLGRVVGFFAMMLGVGLILDAHAVQIGTGVLLAAGGTFLWSLWQGQRAERDGFARSQRRERR